MIEEDKMTDERKEKIKLETEFLRYFVLAGLTIGGGALGLALRSPTGVKLSLAVAGIFCALVLILLILIQYTRISNLIQERFYGDH